MFIHYSLFYIHEHIAVYSFLLNSFHSHYTPKKLLFLNRQQKIAPILSMGSDYVGDAFKHYAFLFFLSLAVFGLLSSFHTVSLYLC